MNINAEPTIGDVLLGLGHFLLEAGADHFDARVIGLHQWFSDHREEMPFELNFDDRGGDHFSRELEKAVSHLSMAWIIYVKSNAALPDQFYLEPVVHEHYLQRCKSRLDAIGLTEDKLRQMAKSLQEHQEAQL